MNTTQIAKLVKKAVRKGNVEVVRYFLNQTDYDPSSDNNVAIYFTSENGNTELVQLLLTDKRVNPSTDDNLAIQLASKNGHWGSQYFT